MTAPAVCRNCGDPARLSKNAVGPREQLGWCAACYRMAVRNGQVPQDGYGVAGEVDEDRLDRRLERKGRA